jgi:hypothetical protein
VVFLVLGLAADERTALAPCRTAKRMPAATQEAVTLDRVF